jgi:hypothetical protein
VNGIDMRQPRVLSIAFTIAAMVLAGCRGRTVEPTTYLSFEAIRLTRAGTEVVVVPELGGRLMSVRRHGEANVIWNIDPASMPSGSFINWGGEKTFVGPHAVWGEFTSALWPPSPGWDPLAYSVVVKDGVIEMSSPPWKDFGILIRRRLWIEADGSLRIDHTLWKVSGEPITVSAWQVAQINPPQAITFPRCSVYADQGYVGFGRPVETDSIKAGEKGTMTWTPAYKTPAKIGTHGRPHTVSARIGRQVILLESVDPLTPFPSPDAAAPVEIYVGSGNAAYAELELLSVPRRLSVGEQVTQRTRLMVSVVE